MNSKVVTAAFAATFLSAGVFAQAPQPGPSPVVTPSTPAPVVAPAAPPAAPAPSQMVYVPRLPTPQELTNAVAAQGRSIERIEQTNAQVTLVTKDAGGQLNTIVYQLLPAAGGANAAPAATVTSPPPAVVYYESAPRVYYYDDYYPRYYYPWYPPVSVHLGFGYYRGFGGGGFHHHR